MKYFVCLFLLLACGGTNQKEVLPLIGHLSIMQHEDQPNLVYVSYLRYADEIVIADGQMINPEIWQKVKIQWRSLNNDDSKTLLQSNAIEDQAAFTVSELYKGQYWLENYKEKGAYLLEAEAFFANKSEPEEQQPLENPAILEEEEEEEKSSEKENGAEKTAIKKKQITKDKAIAQRFISWENKAAYSKISRLSGIIENTRGQEVLVVLLDGYTGQLYFSWSNRDTQKYLLEIPQHHNYLVYLFGDKLFLDAGQLQSSAKKIEKNYSIEPFEQISELGFAIDVAEFSPPRPLTKKNIEIKINLVHYNPSKSIAWLIFHRQEGCLYFKIVNANVEENLLTFSLPDDNILINPIISIHNHETIRPTKQLIFGSQYKENLRKLQNEISAKISLDIDNDGLADSSGDLDKNNDGLIDSEEEEISSG